jgi:hypothetical protein
MQLHCIVFPLQVIGSPKLFGPFQYNISQMTDTQNVPNIYKHHL